MSKRVTIMLDDEVYEKLRVLQAKKIRQTKKHVSFSSIINECISGNLKS